jgi:hypothetical protein
MPGFNIVGSEDNSLGVGKDVKRAHRWRISSFGPVGLSQDDMLVAKSVTMPNIAFAEQEVLGASIAYKFATRPEFGDLVIAFYDLEGLEPKIRSWQAKMWSQEGGIRPSDDYKDKVTLFLTDGAGTPVDSSWDFINAWPKGINHGELLYDSSEFKLITVTITYDWIEYSPIGAAAADGRTVSDAVGNATRNTLAALRSALS